MNKENSRNPFLSVIVPIYNTEKYLPSCLDSILNQTFQDFELILVNDGSTDSCEKICLRYAKKDSRISCFTIPNGGGLKARLYGASKAVGEYVLFCDSDDYYASKTAFLTLYKVISKSHCSVIQFSYKKKYNHLHHKVLSVKNAEYILDSSDFQNTEYPKLVCSFWDEARLTTSVCNKVYHHCLVENLLLRLDPPMSKVFWGDDLILNLYLLASCSSIAFIRDCLYVYRQSVGGTASFSLQTMQDLNIIKQHQLSFLYSRYEEDVKCKIMENIVFSEIAGWFFVWIRQGLAHVNEQELFLLIKESLLLPSFVQARQYYLKRPEKQASDLSIRLLVQGDPEEYIQCARHYSASAGPLKSRAVSLLKNVYTHI